MSFPKISIVMPALNAVKVIESALHSISVQDYPKDKIEILIGDGGSTDGTLEIAKKYGARILSNPLQTGESGKMVALREATGEYVALIDSDNILPETTWLIRMIEPLEKHPEAIGSEPWSYTWRKEDKFITRYCALLGMNDPTVHFLGNYDRLDTLTGKWTEVPHDEQDFGAYLLVKFDSSELPTIGANGTVFRTSLLKKYAQSNYLFDIDVIAQEARKHGSVTFIKVKNGIVHTYCEGNIMKFIYKQRRRVRDYIYHNSQGERSVDWKRIGSKGLPIFVISCITVLPLVWQAIKGYLKKPDIAWFFHILACEITLWEYSWGTILGFFAKKKSSRSGWTQ